MEDETITTILGSDETSYMFDVTTVREKTQEERDAEAAARAQLRNYATPYAFDEAMVAENRAFAELVFARKVSDDEIRAILQAPPAPDCVLGKANSDLLYFDWTQKLRACPICHHLPEGLPPTKVPTDAEQKTIDLLVERHRRIKAGLLHVQLGWLLARFGRWLLIQGEKLMDA
jgi:hypothetical protein